MRLFSDSTENVRNYCWLPVSVPGLWAMNFGAMQARTVPGCAILWILTAHSPKHIRVITRYIF